LPENGLDRARALEYLQPYVDRARAFTGWSFTKDSWRRLGPKLPWDYKSLVLEAARIANSVLDMGTGGGEFLAQISPNLPNNIVATEEWSPNVPVAKGKLSKLGIETVHCKSVELPFKVESFDLVINRHEELDPTEVARIIRPGGRIITQQVGRDNWKELRTYFPNKTDFGDHRKRYAEGFQSQGMRITTNLSFDYKVAYGELGDFVFMLVVTPWTIPGFNLERDVDALLSLSRDCTTENGLELTESRYLLIADKQDKATKHF
jgi:SAM-dependent methyltransferase